MSIKKTFLVVIIVIELLIILNILRTFKNSIIVTGKYGSIEPLTYKIFPAYRFVEKKYKMVNWDILLKNLSEPDTNLLALVPRVVIYLSNDGRLKYAYAHINRYGFRGPAYSLEKPTNTSRIVVIGDSHVFGYGLNFNETFSYQLEKLLNDYQLCDKKWEVINLGIPSLDMIEKVWIFDNYGLNFSPDIVIIQYDGTDIFPRFFLRWSKNITEQVVNKFFSNASSEDLVREIYPVLLDFVIGKFNEKFRSKYWKILTIKMIKNPLLHFHKEVKKRNIKVIVLFSFSSPEERKIVEESLRDYLFEIDISQLLDGDYYLSSYEKHWNATGHKIIAEEIFRRMCEMKDKIC